MCYETSKCSRTFFSELQATSMVRNQLWLVDPGINMFSGGQLKGHLQSQRDSILFLIQEVCFSVLFEIVITLVSKVKEVAESM